MTYFYPQAWMESFSVLSVFLRLLGLFLLVPGFSHRSIPFNVKILLALTLSIALYPLVRPYLTPLSLDLWPLAGCAIKETAIGFLMGFTAYLTFEAISLAAQFIGYQMGFGSAGLIDPQNQSQVSVLVPFHGWITLMIFFLMDMHHQIIRLFLLSYTLTQNTFHDLAGNEAILKLMLLLSAKLFVLAIQMAAPLTLLVLVVNAALGVLSRLLPQMNMLLFAFPLTMLLGFCTLYLVAPEMMEFVESLLGEISTDVIRVLRVL